MPGSTWPFGILCMLMTYFDSSKCNAYLELQDLKQHFRNYFGIDQLIKQTQQCMKMTMNQVSCMPYLELMKEAIFPEVFWKQPIN